MAKWRDFLWIPAFAGAILLMGCTQAKPAPYRKISVSQSAQQTASLSKPVVTKANSKTYVASAGPNPVHVLREPVKKTPAPKKQTIGQVKLPKPNPQHILRMPEKALQVLKEPVLAPVPVVAAPPATVTREMRPKEITAAPPPPEEPASRAPPPMAQSTFLWPVKGNIVSSYGKDASGQINDGINIAAPQGTNVRAAENGIVIYTGSQLKGFGNLMLVRHDQGFVTAYAHMDSILVKKGAAVKRGEIIGKVGKTGLVDRPQLHFEVRKKSETVNPKDYL